MSRISLKRKVFFAKRLAFLMEAGVPLLEALTMLKEQSSARADSKSLTTVISDVSRGHSLGKSLAKPPAFFGAADAAIIAVGESTGTLRENLSYLGNELEKRAKSRGKILAALIYPALVLSAALGIIAFLLLYLFPKIIPVFVSLHRELPFSTKIVIAASTFLGRFGLLLGAALFIGAWGLIFFVRKDANVRRAGEKILFRTPLIGSLFRRQALSQAMRTVGMLLQSGIALPDAFAFAAQASHSLTYREAFEACAEHSRRGERTSEAFQKEPRLFPEVCSQMAAVGERSGNLSDSFLYLSGLYEEETDESLARLSGTLEPALMISMGFIVAFIAISIITPIYGITENLHP